MWNGGLTPIDDHVWSPLLRRRSNGLAASRRHCDHVVVVTVLWNPRLALEWRIGVLVLADFQR